MQIQSAVTRACSACGTAYPHTAEFFPRSKQFQTTGLRGVCRGCYNAGVRRAGKRYRVRLRDELLTHYGDGRLACVLCGEIEVVFLSLDHIDFGGQKHYQEVGSSMYRMLRQNGFPPGYRTLCRNCNCSRRPDAPGPRLVFDFTADVMAPGSAGSLRCNFCLRHLPADAGHFYRHPGFKRTGLDPKCKECKRKYRSKHWRKSLAAAKSEVFVRYGGGAPLCCCCGVSDPKMLTIDHVNGDGKKDREAGLTSLPFLRHILRLGCPDTYRVLCQNCNYGTYQCGVCPHKNRAV